VEHRTGVRCSTSRVSGLPQGLGCGQPAAPSPRRPNAQDDLSQRLAEIDIFRGLSSRQLKKLAVQVREVHLDDGHTVASEGRGALGFHLILDGQATVSSGGVERRTLGPGDYFGEISL